MAKRSKAPAGARVGGRLSFSCIFCGQTYLADRGPRGFCSIACVDAMREWANRAVRIRGRMPVAVVELLVELGWLGPAELLEYPILPPNGERPA